MESCPLAIAIGATTAMFSMLNAVLMQPLPYQDPDRLVLARTTFSGRVNWTSSAQDPRQGVPQLGSRGQAQAGGRPRRGPEQEFDVISANLKDAYPGTNQEKAMQLTGLQDALVANFRPSLLMLMAAVSLVLLIACGNVANLLLARGRQRQTELAVRAAMGAGRSRLLRQLLTESLLIALLAGSVGVILALWFQNGILEAVPLDALGITQVGLNVPMLGFALAASILTSLLFGTVPALRRTPDA